MIFIDSMPITGTGAYFGPCQTWPAQVLCDIPIEAAPITGFALNMATDVLWSLTGMRFGQCEITLRPCRRECYNPWPDSWYAWPLTGRFPQPALIGGLWFNLVCGGCPGTCSCFSVSEFVLPSPVHRIVEIEIDGTPLVSGAYRVDNNRLVVRQDGGSWPRCNDLSLPDGSPGTWTVTALIGEVIPQGAALAMGELFCEIIRGALGGDCRLPAGVSQLVRQGVTIQFPDVTELFRQGRTGLYLVDMFLSTWNPYGLRQRARTYNVDSPTVRRPHT